MLFSSSLEPRLLDIGWSKQPFYKAEKGARMVFLSLSLSHQQKQNNHTSF